MTDMERVAEAIRAFEQGEIVVVMDDDDRENEGDLIVAAVHCTTEKMGFIIRYTGGVVCAPIEANEAKRLNLGPMVSENDAPHATAFTVSIDFKHETTTGISGEDRCTTVRALANGNNGAVDFVRPGHIFPLVAREGGVLTRSGHTEAAVDLCKLSGLAPVGVISELMNDDGSVMRGPQVKDFAETHELKSITVADLIAYRQRQESFVERVDEFDIQTSAGPARAFAFTTPWDPMQHLAVVYGDIRGGRDISVRLQQESIVSDVFGSGDYLPKILDNLAASKKGVIVYLRDGAVGVAGAGLRVAEDLSPDIDNQGENHTTARSRKDEWLEIGLGAQILKDLGVSSIKLLASRERHYVGLDGFGIEISETEILDG